MTHPALLSDEELLAACDIRFTRRSGPGGQHRNKTESAVVITYRPAALSAEASERRSQADNRREALFRLRLVLALSVRTAWEPTALPNLWTIRVVNEKLKLSPTHPDFPAFIAVALDSLVHHLGDPVASATELNISTSQLIKLLRSHPPALQSINALRLEQGLHKLT